MKKKTVIIAVSILIFGLLTAFFIKSQYDKRQREALEAGKEAVIVSHDKTALPDFIYNIDSISLESIVGDRHYDFEFPEKDNLQELIASSSNIVHGRIENLYYTFIDGHAWTMAELKVLDSYKGQLESEDIISLYYPGGYMSLHDYNSCYDKSAAGSDSEFYQSFAGSAPIPYLMEEELFFINSDSGLYSLPQGAFVLSCGNSSLASYTDESNLMWLDTNLSLESILNLIN